MITAKSVLREAVESAHGIVSIYVEDLSDADLAVRAVPGANPIGWQLGHLIGGTKMMLAALGHPGLELPEGFEAAHPREGAGDGPAPFKKAEYMALAQKAKQASLAAIDATPDDELGRPSPEHFREFAPTVAKVLLLLGSHWLMHAGQFVPIRRKLGKPAMF